ncbi:MAG: hypothetical protein IT435_00225 [Phycisphaerales bacterium]|nr:hypothetical protein [Phycisphaerales bacterium]
MSIIGTNTTQSVAGLGQAERVATREVAKREADKSAGRRAIRDEVDLVVSNTEGADAVRSLKGNKDEETREDKQEHPAYAKPKAMSEGDRPSIDVQA